MAVALHGNLRDFGIGEVFQLIGQQRKTGVLEVRRRAGERIHVSLRRGQRGVGGDRRAPTRTPRSATCWCARGLLAPDRLVGARAAASRPSDFAAS